MLSKLKMINKKGRVFVQILILLIVIVFTSAVVLLLINLDVINVSDKGSTSLLDTEFIPVGGRVGFLAVKEFDFCGFINEDFECFGEGEEFLSGEDVYVRFLVESSTSNGQVMLVRNYRMINPSGEVILELDQKNDYNYETKTDQERERIAFADFFPTDENFEEGEYSLEIVIVNPLLKKEIVVTKKFLLFAIDESDNIEFDREDDIE